MKPHQQHILLYLYNYHCKKHESTNVNTYLSPAYTYLDIFESAGYLNPIPN